MKFILTARYIGSKETWEEDYDCDAKGVHSIEEAEKWCRDTIAWFNSTLRPNEKPREFVSVRIVKEPKDDLIPHAWDKTNLVTILRGGTLYDTYKCTKCGITGKRYGVGEITRDTRYKADKYESCK